MGIELSIQLTSLKKRRVKLCIVIFFSIYFQIVVFFTFIDKTTGKYQCLGKQCPPEHFGNSTNLRHLNLTKDELSTGNLQMATFALQECVPCHPECEVCVGPGNHISVCQKCRNWMYRWECVNTCPPGESKFIKF